MTMRPDVVRVFGRDETKQFYQRQRYRDDPRIRFLIGDIRDPARLVRAMEGIDVVFHCAALKHVESGEYNPFEATQTNVVGTQNVIDASLAAGVRVMILTSSDKAANPTSVMGASKLLAEKLVTAATHYRGRHPTVFASVRFGNVLGTRGSAVELFSRQVAEGGPVTVTDPTMTRFIMTAERAVELAICGGPAGGRRGGLRVQDAGGPPGRHRQRHDRGRGGFRRTGPGHDRHGPNRPASRREGLRGAHDRGGNRSGLAMSATCTRCCRRSRSRWRSRSPTATRPGLPIGAYRSDAVEPIAPDEVRAFVAATLGDRRVGVS